MSKVRYRLFYHAVWSTYLREPTITPDIERVVQGIFLEFLAGIGGHLFASGAADDHVHVVMCVPPSFSISEVVGRLKGKSSYMVNRAKNGLMRFAWQCGFWVNSVSERDLPKVIHYVQCQRQRHRAQQLYPELEVSEEGDEDQDA